MNDEDVVFNQQVEVKFSIGNFEDSVLCNIVPMKACHILLRRPWLFERETIHHGHTNNITFTNKDNKFLLHPLTPSQVKEDQVKMRKKRGKERDDTCIHQSKINCSKFQLNTHKSNECPNQRVLMLRAKGLCEDSKEVFFPCSSIRMGRQDQIIPCVEKGSQTKRKWCIILESYMLWMIILITLTLSLIFCRSLFDPDGRKAKHLTKQEG